MTNNLNIVLNSLNDIQTQIDEFYNKTNEELNDAKASNIDKIELNKFYSNYRKDKFLRELYILDIYIISRVIRSYLKYKHSDDFYKIYNYLSQLIDKHDTNIANALNHFSTNGIILVNSFDFNKLNELCKDIFSGI